MIDTFKFLEDFRGKLFTGELPTLMELFLVSEARFPDRKCFTTYFPQKKTLSFKEAKEKIFQLAGSLVDSGLKKGDRVVLRGKNSPEWAVSYLAVLTAGGIIVPVDYMMSDKEIETLAKFSESRFIIIDEEKYDSVMTGSEYVRYSLSENKANYIYNASSSASYDFPVKLKIEDTAAILYTSGTTGTPKGVMLSHSNFVNDALLAQANLNIYHTDVFYALLPLHHSYTMLAVFIESIACGAEIVFAAKLVVKQILSDLKTAKVTMFLGVPMLFNRILKGILKGIKEKGAAVYLIMRLLMGLSGFIKKVFNINIGKKLFKTVLDKASLSSIRICISGGGPLPASTFNIYNQMGIDFVQGYGLTETSPIAALNPTDHFKIKSVGKIIPKVDVKIIDSDSEGRGEIAIKGPIVMQGYYKNPEATQEVMTEDGYFLTGDSGYLDSENYLYLTGRKKSLIVTEGGKNVFPEEIEACFQLYDEVEQILVKGYIKDKKYMTEEIEALLYPSEDLRKEKTAEEIERRINEIVHTVNKELLPYMRITRVRVLKEALEMTTTKKIKRFKVKD